jgi:predicted metalloprotease
MDISGQEESTNVEDRRGSGGIGTRGKVAIGGGVGSVVVIIICMVLGVDPQQFLGNRQPDGPPGRQEEPPGRRDEPPARPGDGTSRSDGSQPRDVDPAEEKAAHFTKVIFGDTEKVWDDLFAKMDRRYEKPILVLFTGQVESACGQANAAVGPFYCPGDRKVYIDLSFYKDMERKLNAPGDFARAYVIAHEVGHHVQKLLGYSGRAKEMERELAPKDRHQASVRLELQADYLAGVWGHHAQKKFPHFLQRGDIESALNAANQIGDDRLQKQARGRVVPDSFTHGTSRQRVYWFKKGFDTGDVQGAKELFTRDYDDL